MGESKGRRLVHAPFVHFQQAVDEFFFSTETRQQRQIDV
jgi:hypothetical protein